MKQYNYKDLEKLYLDPISPKCKRALKDKILDPYPQAMIQKALDNDFSPEDFIELSARGSWKSKEYPGLLYLVDIYISPFTVMRSLMKKIDRTKDKDLIKAMTPW